MVSYEYSLILTYRSGHRLNPCKQREKPGISTIPGLVWRMVGDLNPRDGVAALWFSRPAPSAARKTHLAKLYYPASRGKVHNRGVWAVGPPCIDVHREFRREQKAGRHPRKRNHPASLPRPEQQEHPRRTPPISM